MATTGAGNSISVFELLEALRRRKAYVIVPALLLTLGFGLYAYTQPSRYRATARLAAEQTATPDYLKHVVTPAPNVQDHLWTLREMLFSPAVLEEAAKLTKASQPARGNLTARALDAFKNNIDIKLDGERTFQLSYESPNRYEAMNVANKLAELLVEQASMKHEQTNEETESVIATQIEKLKKSLEQQGKELENYKSQVAHALPEHIDDNFRVANELQFQYQDRTAKIADEEARRTSIQQQIQDLEAKGVLDGQDVYEKTPAEAKLDELRITERELETRYKPSHPDVIKIKRQIEETEKAVAAQPKKGRSEPSPTYLKYVELKSELEAIGQRIRAYKQDQKDMSAKITDLTKKIESIPQHERVIGDMKREYNVGESQFRALLDKQLDAKLARGLASSDTGFAFSIIERAGLPSSPYSPQRPRLVLMGLGAGLGLGLVLAFVLEQNDTTFGTVDDFQSFTSLPILGIIPNIQRIKRRKSGRTKNPMIIAEPESVAAEQYRLLALKIRQQCETANLKVVMITSSAGTEGKSLTAINIAAALAPTVEGRVLLVEADMRRPRLKEYIGITVPPGKGFHDLLMNPADSLDKYVQKTNANFYILPGGVPLANPVAVLSSPKTRAVFERLRQEFAIIIIDAPPTLPVADSHILNGLSDKVVFVVRARQTPRELFQHALDGFDGANLLGAVLNDVDYQRTRYAYAYEYYKTAA